MLELSNYYIKNVENLIDLFTIINNIYNEIIPDGIINRRNIGDRTRFNRIKKIYFGFKFHALTSIDWFITDFIITPSNIDDRRAIWNLCNKYKSISVIGDNGYVNKRLTP